MTHLDSLLKDARSVVRRLAGQPGFTLAALLTLALGIGANTAMFSVVYSVLLRPLPYPEPEGIVRIGAAFGGRQSLMVSNQSFPLIEGAESFEHVAAYRGSSLEWTGPDGAVTLRGAAVSPALFPLLRATPQLGRVFTAEEARPGAARVVLLSHRAWTNRFASNPDIVGAALDLGGSPYTVVGVLPEGFYFPNPEGEFWTPLVVPPFVPPAPPEPGQPSRSFTILGFVALGRLAPGVSAEQAAAEVGTLVQSGPGADLMLRGREPGDSPEAGARVVSLLDEMVGEYRPALLALTAATVVVLLIACVNVAGLLLARGVSRQRTLAVCAALGAGRWRLVRQILSESVALGLCGGGLGLAAAALVLRAVPAVVPGDIARLDGVGVDGLVLAFTLALSVAAGLLFGAVPALQWSRVDLVRTLNEDSVQSTGGFRLLRSNRTRAGLAVAQVALALVLLVGAGLLLRSFVRLVTIDRGYDPANVITARIRNPDLAIRPDTPQTIDERRMAGQRFQESLLQEAARVEALSEVEAVGLSSRLPLAAGGSAVTMLRVAGAPPPADPRDFPQASVNIVSPGYFDAMRLRLRRGRAFTRLDGAGSAPVLVVNETLARDLFGGDTAVGQRVFPIGSSPDEAWEVIGVVADVSYRGLIIGESPAEAFISVHQLERAPVFFGATTIVVRTTGDPVTVIPFLQETVSAASPVATLADVMTMDARLSAAVAQPRFYAVFVGFFASLALFLAAFGVYALLSYTVSVRQREIGVRMALGAQRRDVLAIVVRQGAGLVAAGTFLGLLAAAGSARLLESFLFGVATDDRLIFIAAPLVLAGVALVGCWLPGRRATRIDPMDALRVE